MLRRSIWLLFVPVLVLTACSSDKTDDVSAPTSTATVVTTASPQTASSPDSSSTSTSVSIPPVTPPAGQPAACSLLSVAALAAAGVPAGTTGVAADQPGGFPAPSTGCRWESDQGISVQLYYGRDPLEILALARQVSPGGSDVTGIGQDAYFVSGVLFVDTGSQAFAVNGAVPQDQLEALAQNVLANL